jgi:lipopolysaccharide export system permease protein
MNQLDRYVGVLTLRIFILTTSGLTALFGLLDFVEQLSLVGQGSYSARDALIYTLFIVPSRVLQLAPVAMLLASLLALGLLARNAELTAWRSLGVSEARIIGALLKLSLPIIFALFLIAQYVVPTAQLVAQRAQEAALGESATQMHYGGFWVTHDKQYLNVQQFGFGRMPEDIDIYSFAGDGSLITYLHADRATIEPDGTWTLQGVVQKKVQGTQFVTTHVATLPWASFVTPQHLQLLQLPPETMPPIDLFRYIHELKHSDQQAVDDELVFWSMVSIPLSLLAMVLAAAPFAFGAPRLQSAGRQLLVGALLGIGFELTQQLVFYFGLRLDLPPALTALAPSILLGGGAAYVIRRAHIALRPASR